MPEDPDIASLDLDALRTGDEVAWEQAFRDLWPLALRAAQHPELSLSLEEAQDAASEALVQVVDRVETVASVDQLKALTVTIAYRRAVSLVRRKRAAKRQPESEASGAAAGFDDTAYNLSNQFGPRLTDQELRELVGLLKQALEGLDEETRVLLREKIGHGWSYEELSRKRRIPVGTLCAKVARGLRKVRKALAEFPELANELKAFLR